MSKYAPFVLFAFTVACGSSRTAECEIADCAESTVEACKTAVEACADVGGATATTCIDAQISAVETACDAGGSDTDT